MRAIAIAHNDKGAKGIENVGWNGTGFIPVQESGQYGANIGNILRAGRPQHGFAPIVRRVLNHSGVNESAAKIARYQIKVRRANDFLRNPRQVFVNLESHNISR